MKPMSPTGSEFRGRSNREPTDLQKTARITMIRSRQRAQRGLGNVVKGWPTANAVTPKDTVAFDEDGGETWQRPEPNPIYRSNFTRDLKTFESKSIAEEILEDDLKALNANIKAREVSGETLTSTDPEVDEAIQTYNKLLNTRNDLQSTGSKIASGIETQYRSRPIDLGIGGGTGIALVLGLLYYYRRRPRPSGGPRYIGTTDRLAVFGNF